MFGLVPELDQATSLISHSARHQLPVFAYTFGKPLDYWTMCLTLASCSQA